MDAEQTSIVLVALLAASEALALIPAVKSNGILQLVFGVLRSLTVKKV